MACELEQKRYTDDASTANYNLLKQCQDVAFQRGEQTASRQAQEKYAAQQAETARMYASGEAWKDMKVGPDYQHADISKFLPKSPGSASVKGPNVGLVIAGVLGGGIVLLIILYFLMKGGKSAPRGGYGGYGYGYPPPRKKKAKKKHKKK